jgi:hypothetical protein
MSLERGQNLLAFGFPDVTLWIEVMLGERRLHPGVCGAGGGGSAESSEPFALLRRWQGSLAAVVDIFLGFACRKSKKKTSKTSQSERGWC